MENKQTAVEWLINQLKDMEYDLRLIPNTIELAKKMDKEQKKDAWEDGVKSDNGFFGTFEQYYNETYGGK
jgi:hypothetical protein